MAMEPKFVDAVESITGRKVVAFMAQSHLDPDMSVEIFVLEPIAGDALDGVQSSNGMG